MSYVKEDQKTSLDKISLSLHLCRLIPAADDHPRQAEDTQKKIQAPKDNPFQAEDIKTATGHLENSKTAADQQEKCPTAAVQRNGEKRRETTRTVGNWNGLCFN